MVIGNGIGQGGGDQPAAVRVGGDLGIEHLGEGIQVGGGSQAIPVDGVGRGGAEVHVEVLSDIGCPVHFFGEGGRPAIVVLVTDGRQFGIDEVLALRIIDVGDQVEVGLGMFEGPAVVEIAGYAVGAVEVDIRGAVAAFGGWDNFILDIVDRCAGVQGSEQHMVIRWIEGLVQHPQAVGELGFQLRVPRREIDIVRSGGQGLQLAGAGAAGAAHIIDPQPLVVGERVVELDRGCEVGIIMRYVEVLGGVEAIEVH